MKNKLLTLGGALALMSILGHFYAKPLLAQVRATLVKNVDERGRNPYIQNLACYTSPGNQCTAFFPPVPPNMTLVVEHVSLSVDTPTALSTVDVYGNGIIQQVYLPQQGTDSQGNAIYATSQPFLTYYTAGQQPSVAMFTKAGAFTYVSGSATLTGYLINLNN